MDVRCPRVWMPVVYVILLGNSLADEPWTRLNLTGGDIVQMRSFPGYPDILLCAVEGHGFFRTTDRGETWSLIREGSYHDISVSGDDRAYVAGEGGLLFSDDFGNSWSLIIDQKTWQVVAGRNGTVAADTMTCGRTNHGSQYDRPWLLSLDYGKTWQSWEGTASTFRSLGRKRGSIVFRESGEVYRTEGGEIHVCDRTDWTQWTDLGTVFPESLEDYPPQLNLIPSLDSDSVLYGYAKFYDAHPGYIVPGGVFKSEDFGRTWKQIGTEAGSVTVMSRTGRALLIGVENGDLMRYGLDADTECVVGRFGGEITSIDAWNFRENEWVVSTRGGIFRTVDGGIHWIKSDGGILHAETIAVQVVCLYEPDERIIVSTKNSGIWFSDDSGENWNWSMPAFDTVPGILQVAPSDLWTLYAGGPEIHRSTDGGESFQKLEDFPAAYYGWYGRTMDLDVHPWMSDRIVVSYFDHSMDHYRGDVFAIGNRNFNGTWEWDAFDWLGDEGTGFDHFQGTGFERFQFDAGRNRYWISRPGSDPWETTQSILIARDMEDDTIVAELLPPDSLGADFWKISGDSCFLFNSEKARIWVSTDLGRHWASAELNLNPYTHYEDWAAYEPLGQMELSPDHRFLFLLYPGNGVLVSEDGGFKWKTGNEGLNDLTAYQIAFSSVSKSTAYLATADGIYKREIVSRMAGGENGSNPAVQAANFPNPFNASTTIQFTVPRRSWITLKIYDVAGKEIETLVNGTLEQGHQTIRWEPRNIASGVYLGRLDAGTARRQFKLLLVK